MHLTAPDPLALPRAASLEEAGAAAPGDAAAATAFALWRAAGTDDLRPVLLAATRHWLRERGRPFGRGTMLAGRLLLVAVDRQIEALWAMEEALKSGAVAGAVGAVEAPPFVATRRLDFAAQAGRATAVLLRIGPASDLSAARLRWRIGAAPSAPRPFDARAPGAARIAAELVRRRGGPLGRWMLEQDDETGGLRVAAGLADHGVVADQSAA